MTVHDELTVDGNLEVLSGGVIKLNYGGLTSSPSLTFGSLANGFYYSNLNTISLKSNNIDLKNDQQFG